MVQPLVRGELHPPRPLRVFSNNMEPDGRFAQVVGIYHFFEISPLPDHMEHLAAPGPGSIGRTHHFRNDEDIAMSCVK